MAATTLSAAKVWGPKVAGRRAGVIAKIQTAGDSGSPPPDVGVPKEPPDRPGGGPEVSPSCILAVLARRPPNHIALPPIELRASSGEELTRETYRRTLFERFQPMAGDKFKESPLENQLEGTVAQWCLKRGAAHPWGASKYRKNRRKASQFTKAKGGDIVH